MKRFLLVALFVCICLSGFPQNPDSTAVISAEQVRISRTGRRAERRQANIRKKARELTRDVIEKGRLQFEPEFGFYHGIQTNMNAGHYTKTGTNAVNMFGAYDGWHEDMSGGKYSGKPMLQILNGRLYCNLEPILTKERPDIIGINSRDLVPKRLGATVEYQENAEVKEGRSDETLSNWRSFNTEYYKVCNVKESRDYLLTFDVVVSQYNIINHTGYDKFTFQCIVNILDARMTMRIIAGENRVCATYFGYMEIIRGNSF